MNDRTQEGILGEIEDHRAILRPADREERRGWASGAEKEMFSPPQPRCSRPGRSAIRSGISHPSALSDMHLESLVGVFYICCCHFLFSAFLENATPGERPEYLLLISPLKTGKGKKLTINCFRQVLEMYYPGEQEEARLDCFETRQQGRLEE